MDEPELTRDVQRVNGFAEGDRVAIIGGEYEGTFGKVVYSSAGCDPDYCRDKCRLIRIEITHGPPGMELPPYHALCYVGNVTHID